tara:strand:+ start:120 stop:443 length:324 start_codon:yes stop_codon:yes gene_type:complete
MTTNYSLKQIERMRELAPLNNEKCKKLAFEFEKETRSVRQKAVYEKIPYEKEQRKLSLRKNKEPSKEDIVNRITEHLNVNRNETSSLYRVTKRTLQLLLDKLNQLRK